MDLHRSLWFLGFAATLLLTASSFCEAKEANTLCERIKQHPTISEAEYKKDIGPWFEARFNDWKAKNATGSVESHFWKYFYTKYAPEVAPSIVDCSLSETCSVVSCNFFDENIPIDDQLKAYRSMEAIVNFHNARWYMRKISNEKFTEIEVAKEDFVRKYSDSWKAKRTIAKHQAHQKLALHIITGVLLLVQPGVGAWGMVSAVGMDTVSLIGLSSNAMSSAIGGFILSQNVGTDLMQPEDYVGTLTAYLGQTQSNNHNLASQMFTTDLLRIFSGEQSFLNDSIVDVVKSGYWGVQNKFSSSPEFEQRTRDIWAASFISNIWDLEHTYIVWSDAPNGCESDSRGNGILRVCLKEYPGSSFWIYFLARVHQNSIIHHTTLVRGPPGHELLTAYAKSLDLESIVEASVANYEDHGNQSPFNKYSGAQAFTNYFDPSSSLVQRGGKFAGIFSIPVCYMPDGLGISSINLIKSRNYPCMCGEPPTKKSLRKEKRKSVKGVYPSYDQGFSFLNVTGLYQLKTWHRGCRKSKAWPIKWLTEWPRYSMNCDEDENVSWSGRFPVGAFDEVVHPFSQCRSKGHKEKGCETPANNGKDENENCG